MLLTLVNYPGCAKASTDYKWYSSDMSIVSVSASGVVQAKKPGKATIKVLSIFESFNYDEVIPSEQSITCSLLYLFTLITFVNSCWIDLFLFFRQRNG